MGFMLITVLVIGLVAFMLIRVVKISKGKSAKRQAAEAIEKFISDQGNAYDWDDFISVPSEDAEVERARIKCREVRKNYPSTNSKEYCSSEGTDVLVAIAEELVKSDA